MVDEIERLQGEIKRLRDHSIGWSNIALQRQTENHHLHTRLDNLKRLLLKIYFIIDRTPSAWLMTDVQSGDVEATTCPDDYPSEQWSRAPLFTQAEMSDEPVESVGWQWRYIDPTEGPGPWAFCGAADAEIYRRTSSYQLREVYAITETQPKEN